MVAANLTVFLHRLARGVAAEALGDLPDRELLKRFAGRGEAAAFEVIVRRHGPMVLRVCWRLLRQSQDTEDAFQATFLLLARNAGSLRKPESLASWLHGTARRIALKTRTQRAVRRHHEMLQIATHCVPPDAEAAELRSVLDEELARLPEEWRLPLILCYLEGRTQDEAAAQLSLSTRTLRRRLEEARDVLGRRLARRGVGLSAALSALLFSECAVSAAVPLGLTASTVEAGIRVAASGSAAGIVSADVVALTEGVKTTMFVKSLKTVAALALLVGAVTTGVLHLLPDGQTADAAVATPTANPNPGLKTVPSSKEPVPALPPANAAQLPGKPAQPPLPRAKQGMAPAPQPPGPSPGAPGGALVDAKVRAHSPAELKADKIIVTTDEQVHSATITPDGKIVVTVTGEAGKPETRIKVWDCRNGKLQATLLDTITRHHVALSPSGKELLVGSDGNDKETALYDISDLTKGPRRVRTLDTSPNPTISVAISPDSKSLLVGMRDGSVHVCSAKTGEVAWSKEAHDMGKLGKWVSTVAFSADGKLVVSAGNDSTVQVREAADGNLKLTFKEHTSAVTVAKFSPDGKLIASGGYDGTVRIWKAADGKLIHKIDVAAPDHCSVRSLAFSPDGKLIAVGGLQNVGQTVLGLWDVQTGKQVQMLTGHKGGAFSVGFTKDGTTLMAGGATGGVGLWRLQAAPEKR